VTRRNCILMSLVVSICASVVLLAAGRATNSKVLWFAQVPGFLAFVNIWGLHSGQANSLPGLTVFAATNALAYWPVAFGLSYLVRRPGSR